MGKTRNLNGDDVKKKNPYNITEQKCPEEKDVSPLYQVENPK